jgi:hypothetical protein
MPGVRLTSSREKQNIALLKEMRKVYQASRETYGSPRVTKALNK